LRAFFCLLLLSAAIGLAGPARAADAKVFEVRDVPVDATAAGATAARDQAFAQGQAQAFDILLKRLTRKADWSRLPPAAGQDFKRLIAGFGVSTEKRSATRYIAKVSYSFVAERVRAVLRGAGVPFSETHSKPVLVLPVLETADGKRLLWEPENLWAQIWRESPSTQGLVPMIVPAAGPANTIQPAQLDQPSWPLLEPLATANGAASALVAVLSLRRAGDQLQSDVRLIEVKPGKNSESRIQAQGADERSAMAAAVGAVADSTNESWKQATAIAEADAATLIADVSYDNLDGWLRIRRGLQATPQVRVVRVMGLSSGAAEIEISYVGTGEQLSLGLAQQDLALAAGPDGHYLLSSTAAAPAAPAAPAAVPAATVPGPPLQ
jgi:hypothetical protein